MSLVICSNEIPGSGVRGSQFQAPFSFHNHLEQPLRIPPNSEVAVQSLKINKEGSVSLSPATIWYEYFGVKLTNDNKDKTTSTPHYVDLGIEGNTEATVDTAAKEYIQPALSRGVPNPETFGLPTAAANRDAGGNDFNGWEFNFTQRSNGSALNSRPTTWTNKFGTSGTNGGLSFNSASNTLTPTGKAGQARAFNQAIGEDTPLALNNGEFIVDLTGLKPDGSNVSWAVGLTRCQTENNGVNVLYNPGGNTAQGDPSPAGQRNYYPEIECDFLVGAFQDFGTTSNRYLYAYHLVEDSDDTGYDEDKPLSMQNIDYSNNGDLTGYYNWSTNSTNKQYSKLKFTITNENVKVELYSASSSSYETMVDITGGSATKGKRFKPLCDTCRNLYPFVFIQGRTPTTQPFITIDKWSGRTISGFGYDRPANDWWSYLNSVNLQETLGKAVDTKEYNKFDAGSTDEHDYKGINASGAFEDYEYILVVSEDKDLYVPTDRANAAVFLGYKDQSVVEKTSISTDSPPIVKFISEDAPELKSTTNLFVRLNNYNVKSYNAGQSTSSKIIYAAPRFSTGTDQSVGALFFESPERVYVDLNNPNEINANMFDISLVNENNTLATDIRGKTVCILHIREKKPRM
jgi:hypothetical protein